MKTYKLAALAAVATVVVTGCSNEDFSDFFKGNDNETTIQAVIVGESRSDVTEAGVYSWSAGDAFDVFGSTSGTAAVFTAKDADAAVAGTFTGSSDDLGKYAIYPSEIASSITDDSESVTLTLPAQVGDVNTAYTPNTYAPMLGTKGDGNSYSFRHLAAALRFVVYNIPEGVTGFRLTTNGGEKINGTYSVSLTDAEPTIELGSGSGGSDSYTISFASVADENAVVSSSSSSEEEADVVSEDADETTTTTVSTKTLAHFVVPVPAGTYSKGFKVEILKGDEVIATSSLRKEIALARADLGIYPAITICATEVNGTIEDPTEQSEALQSLKDAFANGGEYKLATSLNVVGTLLTLPAGKDLTIDLNGKTIIIGGNASSRFQVLGNLTIKDSSADKTGAIYDLSTTASGCVFLTSGTGSLTIDGISVYATKLFCQISSTGQLNIKGSKIVVTGGNAINDWSTMDDDNRAEINIEGESTSITASARIIQLAGYSKVNISAGTLTGGTGGIQTFNAVSNIVNISGGTIDVSAGASIQAINSTEVNISGGSVYGYYMYLTGSSKVNISGDANVSGLYYALYALGQPEITIDGNAIVSTDGTCTIAAADTKSGMNSEATASPTITIKGNSTVKVGEGSSASTTNASNYAVNITSKLGTVTVADNATVTSDGYGLALLGYTKAIISGGTISVRSFALSGNGNYYSDEIDYLITGGNLESVANYALYLPNKTNTEISGTAVVTGVAGIAIQRGNLTIKDNAQIISTCSNKNTLPISGDGTRGLKVAAINIPSRYGDTTVNIEGGTITATGGNTSIIDITHNGGILDTYSRTINITGGKFSSDPGSVEISLYTFTADSSVTETTETEGWDIIVAAGYTAERTTQTQSFLAEGYTATQDGDYWVVAEK